MLFFTCPGVYVILISVWQEIHKGTHNNKNYFQRILWWNHETRLTTISSAQSIFAQKYLHKCKDTYFISQNKYLWIYEDTLRWLCPMCSIHLPEYQMYFLKKVYFRTIRSQSYRIWTIVWVLQRKLSQNTYFLWPSKNKRK